MLLVSLTHARGLLYLMSHISFIRMVGDQFMYTIRFDGVNFPENGQLMQMNTVKWQPSTEKMYIRDGVIKGDINMASVA